MLLFWYRSVTRTDTNLPEHVRSKPANSLMDYPGETAHSVSPFW